MIVAKYIIDRINPYIVNNNVRVSNPYLAKKFNDKSEAKRVCIQFGYDLSTIEFIKVA